ncbi:Do family serine endopeptidase [Paraburkholderia caballeronis]|uniref:Do family serine endopeptidase n=1 Tax=Paraburkholderia caballeronis TaxID=416943 RepID=UPI00106481D1|nr:Do family serine endopeptidase [Paraburkholderia caballeronis]TDV04985.1 serine protease Do [Paraburkholderia caballeronis]TDV08153.1 serine protease Do [Paraburkholderia caballeronis]TDV19122.1 serine protease Do [Paraburkholderia caballeronis]
MEAKTRSRGVVVAGFAVAVLGAYAAGHHNAVGGQPIVQGLEPVAAQVPSAAPSVAPSGTPDFSAIVSAYGPAVVNIRVKHLGGQSADGSDQPSSALGSGFIISSDGYILTNCHVVDGADEVTVRLADKRSFHATVVGADKTTDVAVLKIDADSLPTVKIGDPSQSKVGEWVVAIGSPYGLDSTVTSGIISAKARTMSDDAATPFIQTDVPVNPGNSGGPLFNLKGEVIGINSMIYSRTGGFQGLSFAIPIDEAMHVKDQLVKHGSVSRGRIGVGVQSLDQDAAKSLGLDTPRGALVGSVDPDGPAAAAGVQNGDVILSLNGQPVTDANELPSRVMQLTPGADVPIEIWRHGAQKKLTLTVGTAQSSGQRAAGAEPRSHAAPAKLGVAVRPLTDDELQQAGVDSGLLIEQVQGPAARAGLQLGDIIVGVNDTAVSSVDELRQMIAGSRGRVSIVIARDGAQMSVPVQLG